MVNVSQMVSNSQTNDKSNTTSKSLNPQLPTSSPTTFPAQVQEKKTSLKEQSDEAAAFQHLEVRQISALLFKTIKKIHPAIGMSNT